MGQFEVDPSERKKAIPAGEYTVGVIAAEVVEPKKGNAAPGADAKEKFPSVSVDFIVQEGEYKGETFMDMFSLSPKARPRLATFVTELGMAAPGSKGNMSFDTADMLGRELIVKGKIEEFGGMERFRPTSFKALAPLAEAAPVEPAPAAPAAPAPAAAAPPARPAAPPARPASAPARRPV